ncbi:GNAT family N-acetyltransferase [Actinoplanes sp. G11-F43]|uniref:GNAT family N-acetyltransferase n=1 Tax=Actinoplanes sp. G11-F43 TaxID=3424130 RepID=UPI003D33D609
MFLRTFTDADVPAVLDLAIAVFGPFHEESFRPAVGETVFANQDGSWRQEYADRIPTLRGAVAEIDGRIAGFVAWTVDPVTRSGDISHVAVSAGHRRAGLGKALCEHAFAQLKQAGAEVVTIGTGGDDFHAPARELYASLGCTPFPLVTYYREL